MKIQVILKKIFFVCIFFISGNLISQQISQKEIDNYLTNLPFSISNLKIVQFPERKFNIVDYGAVGNGLYKNTESIQNAINECTKNGGGIVVIPSGLWLCGPIELKENVNLHLVRGAVLVFSSDRNDFPLVKYPNKSGYTCAYPIYASNVKNISITGEGLIDANGESWRPVKKSKLTESQWKNLVNSGGVLNSTKDMWWPSENAEKAEKFLSDKIIKNLTKDDYESIKDFYRPNLLNFDNCSNFLLEGVTFQNSPKFAIYLSQCKDIIIYNIKINNEWWAQNGDGIDISASKNVLIAKCTINAGDDGICMKSSKSGKTTEPALQNIVISDCVVYHAHGGFVIGSNTDGGMKNISVKNCNFINTDTGLRFKSGNGRGGIVEDIFIENIYMKNIESEAIIFDLFYEDKGAAKTKDEKKQDKIPIFQNISMNNIVCDGSKKVLFMNSLADFNVKNIKLQNSFFTSEKGIDCSESESILFDNISLNISKGPIIVLSNCRDIKFNAIKSLKLSDLFFKASGKKTERISVSNSNYDKSKKKIDISSEIDINSIIFK